jgi:hypothetical protein
MFGVTIEEDYCAVINLLLLRGRKKSFLQVVCMYDVPGRRERSGGLVSDVGFSKFRNYF